MLALRSTYTAAHVVLVAYQAACYLSVDDEMLKQKLLCCLQASGLEHRHSSRTQQQYTEPVHTRTEGHG